MPEYHTIPRQSTTPYRSRPYLYVVKCHKYIPGVHGLMGRRRSRRYDAIYETSCRNKMIIRILQNEWSVNNSKVQIGVGAGAVIWTPWVRFILSVNYMLHTFESRWNVITYFLITFSKPCSKRSRRHVENSRRMVLISSASAVVNSPDWKGKMKYI